MNRVLPILFNTDMVRAILAWQKTETRRVIKKSQCKLADKQEPSELKKDNLHAPWCDMTDAEYIAATYKPPCDPGDVFYVRETWAVRTAHRFDASVNIMFKAGGEETVLYFPHGGEDNPDRQEYDDFIQKWDKGGIWHPSIHMPRAAARIWLEVTNVRPEHLQDMNGRDILREGVNCHVHPEAHYFDGNQREMFSGLWDSTIRKPELKRYGWDANPWVWAIKFKQCEKPEPCIFAGIEPADDKRPCIGYSRGEMDDEPCEMCKGCKSLCCQQKKHQRN